MNKNGKKDAITEINNLLISQKEKTLSAFFTKEDLYLPNHKAYEIAESLKDLNINQLRKIFDMIEKAAVLSKDGKFEQSLENLFMVVPLVAYATGRKLINPVSFNTFIQIVITPDRIKSDRDVQVLFKLMQSIIAYKKTK